MGGVLLALRVEGLFRPARGNLEARREAEDSLHVSAHAREKRRVDGSRPDPPQRDLAHVAAAGPAAAEAAGGAEAAPPSASGSRIVIVVP